MKMQHIRNTNYLTRKRWDDHFEKLASLLSPLPKQGWIAEIRKALQMTTAQLAKRLGVPQSNVSIFEKAERNKKITLQSLERAAEALDCTLHYYLIPNKGLEATLTERARKLNLHDEEVLEHHMRLEGQGSKSDSRRALEIAMLVLNNDKRLWEDAE